jgi:serine beta-lactamase-like protein LACTB, mitochondrial
MFQTRQGLTGVAVASTLLLAPQAAWAVAPESGDPAAISDRILAALVEANGVPGMGASVWRDGEIVWTGSAGYRDVETGRLVNANTVFRLASVSKTLAATAAAKLKEDGALDVEAPVRSVVTWLPDRWPVITPSQLAAHTSGLPHYQEVDANLGTQAFTRVRDAVSLFQDRDLLTAPGATYEYSTWGFTLLSAVVEESAGRPYLDYLATAVTPGLKIGPDATDTDNPDASTAYAFAEDGSVGRAPPADFSYSWGGAGMGATAPDLARWGGRLVDGEVVSRATFDWMTRPAPLADGSEVREGAYTVGFGWRAAEDRDGRRIVHHAGVTLGARSVLLLYPDDRLAVTVLSNAMWTSGIEQTAQMIAAPFHRAMAAVAVPCPVHAVAWDGEFDGKALTGTARFAVEDGICIGEIGVENEFGAWLNGFPQKDATAVKIIGVDADGGLSRAALVTAAGVYDLRARENGGHTVVLGPARAVLFAFRNEAAGSPVLTPTGIPTKAEDRNIPSFGH